MPQNVPTIRNSVRAFIQRGDSILVQHKKYDGGRSRYTLPGGAVDPGETLAEGLNRECMEEVGTNVEIIDLMHVADYFKDRETEPPSRRQQVEFIFRCRVSDEYEAQMGAKPDNHQIDVLWLPISEIATSGILPARVREILATREADAPVYLGLIK